jgi:hypothetical protein
VFEHLQLLWIGIWLHTHTVTTTDVSPDLGELAESLGDASAQPYHYAIVEAVEPFKLHPTFLSYLHKVFEHLRLLCIDIYIWMHIHSVTTTDTDASPDLGELAESLGDVSVQFIPLRNG